MNQRSYSRRRQERKKGGFFWIWDKIRSVFFGGVAEGGEAGSSLGGAASAASRLGSQASEALGQISSSGFGAGVGVAQSSIWFGRAIFMTMGASVIAAGVILGAHSLSSSAAENAPHFGPIESLIHLLRPGKGTSGNSNNDLAGPSGGMGSQSVTTNSENASAGNLTSSNGSKAGTANSDGPSGKTAAFPSSYTGLPSAKLSTDLNDGAPITASAPKEAGQAAQEARLVKNGEFSANNKISVTPFSASPLSPYLAAYVGVGKGSGFSRAFGGLRGMSEYVHPMDQSASYCGGGNSSCDSSAGNAISQWENAQIVSSGQGISMGGANSGNADAAGTPNPTAVGGSGGEAGTSSSGDISNVCSADQIQKGYVSSGGSCMPGFQASPTNRTPWQGAVNIEKLLTDVAIGFIVAAATLFYLIDSAPITFFDALRPLATALGWAAASLGAGVIALGGYIVSQGGSFQGSLDIVSGGFIISSSLVLAKDPMNNITPSENYDLLLSSVGAILTMIMSSLS